MWQVVVVLMIFAQALNHQQYKTGQTGSLWFIFFLSLKHQECKQHFEATNAKQTARHLFWFTAEQWQEAGRREGLL